MAAAIVVDEDDDIAVVAVVIALVVVVDATVVVVVGMSPVIGVLPFTTRLQPTSRAPLRARAANVTLRARECISRD